MSAQPICKCCGQLINERYLLALSAVWHPEHFLRSGCNRPMNGAAFYEHQGRSYHQQCYLKQIASRCVYCGKLLVSKYVKDSWDTKLCAEHMSEYPGCQLLGRLIPQRGQASNTTATSQQVRCLACKTSAIETIDQARPLFVRLTQRINKEGLLYNNLDLRIKLRNTSQIVRIGQQLVTCVPVFCHLSSTALYSDFKP